jgi:hypothetical protein
MAMTLTYTSRLNLTLRLMHYDTELRGHDSNARPLRYVLRMV